MPSVPPISAALENPTSTGPDSAPAPYLSPKDFERLYAAHFHSVTRWVRAFGCPAGDIDDVAQETFLVARRRLSQFEGGNAAGWLYRIAQHVTRAHRRRAWLRRMLHIDPDTRESRAGIASPVEALEQREARQQIQAILSRMSERRRTAFVLFEVEGYTGEELAELEGVAVNTIYTRVHHARRDFMTLLARSEAEGKLR